MRTAVDTNVLLDLLAGDEAAIGAARSALAGALAGGSLVICPVVYAELAASFPDPDTLDRFLHDLQLKLDDFSRDALVKTAAGWRRYTRNRMRETHCPRCGHTAQLPVLAAVLNSPGGSTSPRFSGRRPRGDPGRPVAHARPALLLALFSGSRCRRAVR